MSTPRHTGASFETVIEEHLLAYSYVRVAPAANDKARAKRGTPPIVSG